MEPVPKAKQMALEFPNISAWVPDLFGPGSADSGNIISKALQKLHLSRSTQPAGKPKERQVRPTLTRLIAASQVHASEHMES